MFNYNFVLTKNDIEALLSNDKETIAKVFDSANFINEGLEAGRNIGLKEGIKLGKKIGFRNALIVMILAAGGYFAWSKKDAIKEFFSEDNDTLKEKKNEDEIIDNVIDL